MIKVSNIKPNPDNPRLIKDHKFESLVKSLRTFPEMMDKRPMVCVTDNDRKIFPLGGNMRFKAIAEIFKNPSQTDKPVWYDLRLQKSMPDNWVQLADDWTQEQRKEFVIKDNVSFGEWDFEGLANGWDEVQLLDWGLDLPIGMEDDEEIQIPLKLSTPKVTVEFESDQEAERFKKQIRPIVEMYEGAVIKGG